MLFVHEHRLDYGCFILMICVITGLNKYPLARVCFPELRRNAKFLSFKNTVEIRYVVEPALIGDLGNGIRRIDQHPRSVT